MTRDERVNELLKEHGRTYAEEAGIKLSDRPAPLYQLHVLATLLSARISSDIAVAAARELFAAGYRTPDAMCDASWQDRVDALGRGHYRRYDERTSTMLGDAAARLIDDYRGDLRRLRDDADGDAEGIARRLTRFPGIGPAGASIFLREVQETWPSVAPYVDDKMAAGARKAGLPAGRDDLAGMLARAEHPAALAAALIRESLSREGLWWRHREVFTRKTIGEATCRSRISVTGPRNCSACRPGKRSR